MKTDSKLLEDVPIRNAFIKLAVPAVTAQLINILYNLSDGMFIGHIPQIGKQALAAFCFKFGNRRIFGRTYSRYDCRMHYSTYVLFLLS